MYIPYFYIAVRHTCKVLIAVLQEALCSKQWFVFRRNSNRSTKKYTADMQKLRGAYDAVLWQWLFIVESPTKQRHYNSLPYCWLLKLPPVFQCTWSICLHSFAITLLLCRYLSAPYYWPTLCYTYTATTLHIHTATLHTHFTNSACCPYTVMNDAVSKMHASSRWARKVGYTTAVYLMRSWRPFGDSRLGMLQHIMPFCCSAVCIILLEKYIMGNTSQWRAAAVVSQQQDHASDIH
jgi:hypothetical protein